MNVDFHYFVGVTPFLETLISKGFHTLLELVTFLSLASFEACKCVEERL